MGSDNMSSIRNLTDGMPMGLTVSEETVIVLISSPQELKERLCSPKCPIKETMLRRKWGSGRFVGGY